MNPIPANLPVNRPSRSAQRLVLLLTAIGLSIGVLTTARLAAVVTATPTDRWFAQDARLVDPSLIVAPSMQGRADALAHIIPDASLFRGRLPICLAAIEGAPASDATLLKCLDAIDQALGAAPASAELWLFKATMLLKSGNYGQETQAALRNSYETGPREGWIASGRVVLGLRIWAFLPSDLQDSVRGDLELVLDNNLTGSVAEAYATDLALRRAAVPALQALPNDMVDKFVSAVRSSLRAGPDAGSDQ
jgi:hypothetical protein